MTTTSTNPQQHAIVRGGIDTDRGYPVTRQKGYQNTTPRTQIPAPYPIPTNNQVHTCAETLRLFQQEAINSNQHQTPPKTWPSSSWTFDDHTSHRSQLCQRLEERRNTAASMDSDCVGIVLAYVHQLHFSDHTNHFSGIFATVAFVTSVRRLLTRADPGVCNMSWVTRIAASQLIVHHQHAWPFITEEYWTPGLTTTVTSLFDMINTAYVRNSKILQLYSIWCSHRRSNHIQRAPKSSFMTSL